MGSKRAMLKNGLGETLQSVLPKTRNFYDLFCGTGSVAGYVAQACSTTIHCSDLQSYAVALAKAQINPLNDTNLVDEISEWSNAARLWISDKKDLLIAAREISPCNVQHFDSLVVLNNKKLCESLSSEFPIARAYGGYYFSALQAITIDALRVNIPSQLGPHGLAALIDASSSCAAAPGHTAQPFSAEGNALPHLIAAWRRDIGSQVLCALNAYLSRKILSSGTALCNDAVAAAASMDAGDLAFIDPPYSDVQYSRFYHVLETIASGYSGVVSGSGRYPPRDVRPQSLYSLKRRSSSAFSELIRTIAVRGGHAIVTFPEGDASNGLSGSDVEVICREAFKVKIRKIASTFSTLGGTTQNRRPRLGASELILYLEPR